VSPLPDSSRAPPGATLRVRHLTRYDYDSAVELAHHLAHLRPRETPWQAVSEWQLDIQPEPDDGAQALDASVDVFGNWRHCFSHARVHDRLEVTASFVAALREPAVGAGGRAPALPGRQHDARRLRVRARVPVRAAGGGVRPVRGRPVRTEPAAAGGCRSADAPRA
jgi:hypothetical protein